MNSDLLNTPAAAGLNRIDSIRAIAVVFLFATCLINVPVFLFMGLDSDVSMYDVCSRGVDRGQVHYLDQLETNFPGVVWIHLAVRSLLGWSSIALRAFDVVLVALASLLIARWSASALPGMRVFVVAALMNFYWSTSEWCHCQRDFWMLVPALVALMFREQATFRVKKPGIVVAVLEGMLWATACWIKPYVAIPAAACLLTSAGVSRRNGSSWNHVTLNLFLVLFGGLAVGAAGVWWLLSTNAWPEFLEVMLHWNREYFVHDATLGNPLKHLLAFANRFEPWVFALLPAIVISIGVTVRKVPQQLLLPACFFLAWMFQAFAIQQAFDYVRAPVILVAIGLCFAAVSQHRAIRTQYWVVIASLAMILFSQVPLWVARVDLLRSQITSMNTGDFRDRATRLWRINWSNLDEVVAFLRAQNAKDGEVTCFSLPVVAVYRELDVLPSTRFVFLHDHLHIFASRRSEIKNAVSNCNQRWLICDTNRFGGAKLRAMLDGNQPDPWRNRVVFRSGPYVVFEMSGTDTVQWIERWYDL